LKKDDRLASLGESAWAAREGRVWEGMPAPPSLSKKALRRQKKKG